MIRGAIARVRTGVRVLLGSLILIAVGINLANIVGRYVFSSPIFWAEESIVFIQIWCVLVGAALVSFENAHLRMDAFEHLAPVRIKALFGRVALILTVIVAALVAGVSATVVAGMFTSDQRSMALELPMALPYAAFPIGFALIALVAAAQLFASGRANPADTPPPPERKGAS